MAAAGGRLAEDSCRVQWTGVYEAPALKADEGPMPVEKVELRIGIHEVSALKVDEGDLFLAADAPHGGRRRPLGGR